MSARTHALLALALLACPACAVEDDDAEFRSSIEMTGGTGPGTVFNTHHIEDGAFSELVQPMGEPHLGIALDSVVLRSGVEVDALEFEDGEIVALDAQGKPYRGKALIDSQWDLAGWFVWAAPVSMRLAGTTEIDGVPHYDFQHLVGKEWVHNCEGETKSGRFARILWGFSLDQGTGDIAPAPGNAFIACKDAAVGKAASWGYYGQAKMSGHYHALETAIRVVRADYCYDGASHTQAGTPLQVEDVWGYREPTDEALPIEAVWGATGLLCVGAARSKIDILATCPGLDVDTCKPGSTLDDYPGALFLTRSQPSADDELAELLGPGVEADDGAAG